MSIVNTQQLFLMSTVNVSHQQLMLHVNSYWFMSTKVVTSPRAAKIESTKHDPLKLVTIIHESQDVYPFLRTIV